MIVLLAVVAWLLTYLVHSTMLIGGALGLAGLGIVRSPAARDTLWKVALIGGLVTATAQQALRLQPAVGHVALAPLDASPYLDVATVRPAAEPSPATAAVLAAMSEATAGESAAPAAAASEAPQVRRLFSGMHIGFPGILLNLWLVGALGLLARLAWLRLALARRLRDRRPVTGGPMVELLTALAHGARVRAPRLSASTALGGPIAFGDEIVVPERIFTDLAPCAQRAVLAHELCHIVRRDPRWLVTASVIETVLFVQPLNALARRRLQETSEFLCDAWAAQRAGGLELAQCLAEVAGWMQAVPRMAGVAAMAEEGSQLVSRVKHLLIAPPRPPRRGAWLARAALGAAALGFVAYAAPGVATEDLSATEWAETPWQDESWAVAPAAEGEGWAAVRDGGRVLVLAAGWSARLEGSGSLAFRQWGRGFVVPEGWHIEVNGERVRGDRELCESEDRGVRFVGPTGSWHVTPVRLAGAPAYAQRGTQDHEAVLAEAERALESRAARLGARVGDVSEALDALQDDQDAADEHTVEMDGAMEAQLDAAIDSIVEIWHRDPRAAERVARRMARQWEREFKPEFERLGIALGEELAPELARMTTSVARDYGPEFARLGAALGATILESLNEAVAEAAAAPRRVKK